MEKQFLFQIILSLTLAVILSLFFKLYGTLVAAPRRLRRRLNQQGIVGPPPAFLLGSFVWGTRNSRISAAAAPPSIAAAGAPATHDCGATIFSIFTEWRRRYGDLCTFSRGNKQMLLVNNYEVAKGVTTCISLDLGKPSYQAKDLEPLLGRGILTSNGTFWAYQRKILAPELFLDKVKEMTNLIQESTSMLVDSWKGVIDGEGGKAADIKIDDYLRKFSSEVISRACFGSSYAEGQQFFHKLKALQHITAKKSVLVGIPGMRFVPTKTNRKSWKLQREVGELILKLVKQKNEANLDKCNLLQTILQCAQSSNLSPDAIENFIIDNCKNIFLAGYETTAVAATWCLMLLASSPEWQDRVREEVIGVCKGQVPNLESIKQMEQLTMVVNESLRLYSPVPIISREALNDLEFANTCIPKGVTILIMVTSMHTDPAIWGPDSYQFNPERFANGITGACKLPHLFMPFGVGPRICLGQNLAMLELKILLSMILSNFSLTISPKYIHAPVMNLVIEPKNGVDLVIEKLKSPIAAP